MAINKKLARIAVKNLNIRKFSERRSVTEIFKFDG